ncbi:hypothetical protein JCM16303_000328 [Sporobolomyces ruberrimus]
MLSPFPLALVASLAVLQATVSALPTSDAPTCGIKCFQKKVEEGDYLAPGAKGLHGLCSTPEFVQAYNNCIQDNCKEDYLESAYIFGVNVCTGKLTTSAAHGDSSSSRKLSTCRDGETCTSSAASTSAPTSALTDSAHPSECTCTETSHTAGATQVYVGAVPTGSSNASSITSDSPTSASIQPQATPSSTSSANTLSIGIGSAIVALLVAVLA